MAPLYNLAQYLNSLIKHKQIASTNNLIINTHYFIDKINQINIVPGCKMTSLYIKIPYTSIAKI